MAFRNRITTFLAHYGPFSLHPARSVNSHSGNLQIATMSSPFSINLLTTTRNSPSVRVYLISHGHRTTCSSAKDFSKKFTKSTSRSLRNKFNFLNGIPIHLHNSLFYPPASLPFCSLSNRFGTVFLFSLANRYPEIYVFSTPRVASKSY